MCIYLDIKYVEVKAFNEYDNEFEVCECRIVGSESKASNKSRNVQILNSIKNMSLFYHD